MGTDVRLNAIKESCIDISKTAAGETNDLGGKIQRMILCYYQDVRKQTQQSFYLALVAAAVGTFFYFYAIVFQSGTDASKLSLIAGGLIHIISALNFVLYGKAAKQFSTFHVCLERTNRFLLANTLCDNIGCMVKKDITRQFLIETIANAPMIHIEGSKNSDKGDHKNTTIENFTKGMAKVEPSEHSLNGLTEPLTAAS